MVERKFSNIDKQQSKLKRYTDLLTSSSHLLILPQITALLQETPAY